MPQLAAILDKSGHWVRDHARQWGGVKIGGEWKFFKDLVDARLQAARSQAAALVLPFLGEQNGSPGLRLPDPKGSPRRRGRGQAAAKTVEDRYGVFGGGELPPGAGPGLRHPRALSGQPGHAPPVLRLAGSPPPGDQPPDGEA